jgi:hypothetical protein
MDNEVKPEFDPNAVAEIEQTELETIADALRMRSGLQAGSKCPIQPCL